MQVCSTTPGWVPAGPKLLQFHISESQGRLEIEREAVAAPESWGPYGTHSFCSLRRVTLATEGFFSPVHHRNSEPPLPSCLASFQVSSAWLYSPGSLWPHQHILQPAIPLISFPSLSVDKPILPHLDPTHFCPGFQNTPVCFLLPPPWSLWHLLPSLHPFN